VIQQVFHCAACQKDALFTDEQKSYKELLIIPNGWYSILIGPIYQSSDICKQLFCSLSCLRAYLLESVCANA
jgi:hypothetical protein